MSCLSLAQAQPAPTHNIGAEQPIVFSSPDGESSISNALLPAAHAPLPADMQDYPGAAPDSFEPPQLDDPTFPRQAPTLVPQQKDQGLTEDQDQGEGQGHVRLKTSAEIMGIPTLQEIFGLPKPDPDQKDRSRQNVQNVDTNSIYSDDGTTGSSSSDDARWQKILSGNNERYAFGADKVQSATNMMSSGFFGSTPGDNFFKSHEKSWDDTAFGSTPVDQTLTLPSQPDSLGLTPANGPGLAQSFSPVNSSFGSGLNPQSPFELPKSTGFETPPQPPAVPNFKGQNDVASQPATPSWAPKPAPWLSPVPQTGIEEEHPF